MATFDDIVCPAVPDPWVRWDWVRDHGDDIFAATRQHVELTLIAVALGLVWVVATLVFLVIHLSPGDPAELLLSRQMPDAEKHFRSARSVRTAWVPDSGHWIHHDQPERLLGPLMRASLENALASGEGALTGPVARGDAGTVRVHREALLAYELEHGSTDIRQAYEELARATAKRAFERGLLKDAQATEILDILSTRSTPEDPQ